MLNKTLQQECDRGLPDPLYYIWSGESFFLEDALSVIVEAVLADGAQDFNFDTFDSSSSIQNILDAVSTLPFMARKRLVVLKDFHQFSAAAVKALKNYFDDPSPTTCLVVLSHKAPKASAKMNCKVFGLNIKDWDIPKWLKGAAAKKGLRLTDDAVGCLIEYVGYDIGLLLMEIEKLLLSDKKTITGQDIADSTSMVRDFTSFDLLDSLIGGQKTRAFRILNAMLAGNAFEATVILGTLNWHYRQFYSLWHSNGKRPAKMREKTFRTLVKYVHAYREDNFLQIFRNLHEADMGIKSSGRPKVVLEILLIRLLQKGTLN